MLLFNNLWCTLCRYIFYFENNNPLIHVRYISGLIALINEQMGTDGDNAGQVGGGQQMGSAVKAHYRNTLGKLVLHLWGVLSVNLFLFVICVQNTFAIDSALRRRLKNSQPFKCNCAFHYGRPHRLPV